MAAVGMMAYPARDNFNAYPQQYAMYPARNQAEVAQAINGIPYANYTSTPQSHQQQQQQPQPQQLQQQLQHHQHNHAAARSPQPSGSPVSDDGFKPSLPSISNLLGIADRPTHDVAAQHAQTSTQILEQAQQRQPSPQQYHAETRSRHQYHAQEQLTSPRTVVQPTVPLRTDSVLEGNQSPSGSSLSGPPYFVGSAINNVEPADQRATQVHILKRNSVPSQPNLSPYGSARYTSSPYATSPAGSTTSYFSPTEANYPVPHNLYQQRPLPSNFPPQPMAVQQSTHMPTSNPWEHHHYISPSSQATFPQSQDRYICNTCNKAFSRPSSLKIHTNSHTGEKPFKCPQAGCGKAFSVRSNMKRHHRGCHSTGVPHMAHQHPHMMV